MKLSMPTPATLDHNIRMAYVLTSLWDTSLHDETDVQRMKTPFHQLPEPAKAFANTFLGSPCDALELINMRPPNSLEWDVLENSPKYRSGLAMYKVRDAAIIELAKLDMRSLLFPSLEDVAELIDRAWIAHDEATIGSRFTIFSEKATGLAFIDVLQNLLNGGVLSPFSQPIKRALLLAILMSFNACPNVVEQLKEA